MLIRSPNGENFISIEFIRSYEFEDAITFAFEISAYVNGFTYGEKPWASKRMAIRGEDLGRFLQDLRKLNQSLMGKAEVSSVGDDFRLSFESHKGWGHHGYLLVTIFIQYETWELDYSAYSPIENSFQGSFIVEPANLAKWLDEFTEAYEQKGHKRVSARLAEMVQYLGKLA